MLTHLRVAIVHDWLTGMRGGEKVLEVFCDLFPNAPIFTLVHFPGSVSNKIESHPIHTSFLQKIPGIKKYYRHALPLMPKAIESLPLDNFDLILSTSHCVAKGCLPPKNSIHISYCHTPMRYIWDQYENYFGRGQSSLMTSAFMKLLRPSLQKWDKDSSQRVTYFIANSKFVKERINRFYSRDSKVIYPPTDTDFYVRLEPPSNLSDYFLIVSALVPYKRVDLAIQAFNRSGKPLKIIGSGPEESKLKKYANKNIQFIGWSDNETLKNYYQNCKALIFTGTEDFGIVPVEAMACGKPVIAYRAGGVLETVQEGKTGIFFHEATPQSLLNAIEGYSKIDWDSTFIRNHALNFGQDQFRRNITSFLENTTEKYNSQID